MNSMPRAWIKCHKDNRVITVHRRRCRHNSSHHRLRLTIHSTNSTMDIVIRNRMRWTIKSNWNRPSISTVKRQMSLRPLCTLMTLPFITLSMHRLDCLIQSTKGEVIPIRSRRYTFPHMIIRLRIHYERKPTRSFGEQTLPIEYRAIYCCTRIRFRSISGYRAECCAR